MPARRMTKKRQQTRKGYRRILRQIGSKWPKHPMLRLKRSYGFDCTVTPYSVAPAETTGIQFCSNAGQPFNATPANKITPFSLELTRGYNELEDLFDEYRIRKVVSKFTFTITSLTLTNNTGVGGATGYNAMPMIHWAEDTDDGTPPTSVNYLREFNTYKSVRLDKPVTIVTKPRMVAMGLEVAGTGYFKPPVNTWINMANHGMNHYGFKYAIDPVILAQTSPIGVIRVDHTFYIECRSTR